MAYIKRKIRITSLWDAQNYAFTCSLLLYQVWSINLDLNKTLKRHVSISFLNIQGSCGCNVCLDEHLDPSNLSSV